MTVRSKFVWSSIVCSLCAACSGRPVATDTRSPIPLVARPATSHAPAATASASATADAPAGHPATARTVTATVLETMNASNYTYVRVQTGTGELWAAASQFTVAVGDKVVVSLDQPMENFHSQSLNRDFPLIYFVSQIARASDAAAPQQKIEPARGGTTIGELWKNSAALAGKTVTVRGKVVKFNGGILGVNWIHLQDGTGTAADGSNDITVTSDMDAQVGDIVSATGVVGLNKDLGSGYKYPVIVEKAALAK